MDIRNGNRTSEFYATIVSSLVGAGALFGIIASDQAQHLINAGVTIISAIIAVAPAVAYIWGRTWLKGQAISGPTKATSSASTTVVVPTETGTTTVTQAL